MMCYDSVMTIKDVLKADLTAALKDRDTFTTMTLRTVLGSVQTQEKAGKTAVEFSDEQVLNVIAKEAKKRNETAEEYIRLRQEERAEKELAEAALLSKYLPEQLSREEVSMIVDVVMKDFPNASQRDMGNIMKLVNEQVSGRAEGRLVAELVKANLTQ